MKAFRSLFGGEASSIRKTCVLSPFITREILQGFRIEKLAKGSLFSLGDNGLFTLIVTGMGALWIGDAVLHLEKTPCEDLILFGSCGALPDKDFHVGKLTLVEKAFSQDSFVHMLLGEKPDAIFYPNKALLNGFLTSQNEDLLKKATCLTVGSLKLEEQYLDTLQDIPVDIVDMETSAFYSAARYAQKKALSFLFVTDVLKTFPYYKSLEKENRANLKNITAKASKTLISIINTTRND
jgi:purine-nucleoside phosphorylase